MIRNVSVVRQIIPAVGVVAVFKDGKRYPVVCWALVNEDTGDEAIGVLHHVVGMILADQTASLDFCGPFSEQCGGEKFDRYLYEER